MHAYSGSGNDSASGSSAEDGGGGERVVSVQFANPRPPTAWDDSVPPFFVGHPKHINKKVRIVHITDFAAEDQALNDRQVSELPPETRNIVYAMCTWQPSGRSSRGKSMVHRVMNRRHGSSKVFPALPPPTSYVCMKLDHSPAAVHNK